MTEIERTVNFVKEKQIEFFLLHCNSTYPSPVELLNLSLIPVLQEKSKLSLYDVEYKLSGMNVVPVDKNTGKVLDEKQIEDLRKQLLKNWRFEDEDEDE